MRSPATPLEMWSWKSIRNWDVRAVFSSGVDAAVCGVNDALDLEEYIVCLFVCVCVCVRVRVCVCACVCVCV